MKKVILVCDECKTETPEERAVNWISLSHPLRTIVVWTSGTVLPGLFCSIKCLQNHIDKIDAAQTDVFVSYEIAVWDNNMWREIQDSSSQ